MRSRTAVAALVAAGFLAAAAQPARAQDETLNRARESFDKAQELFAAGSYAEAAAKFEEAYAVSPFSQFLFNIGACHEKLKEYDKAAAYYRKYVTAEPNAPDRAKTEKRIAALDKAVEELKAAPPPDPTAPPGTPPPPVATPTAVATLEEVKTRGFVVILSEPPGAIIYLDSKKSQPLSKTPWNGPLEGEHLVLLEREGYKPAEERLAPDPKQLLILKIVMGDEDYLGWVDISSNVAEASIFIDDKTVPLMQRGRYQGNLPPGKHTIWVTADGYEEFTQEVNVVAAETYKVQANLKGNPVGYLDVRGRDVEHVKIYLDGKVLCERGPCREPVPAGPHRVEVTRSGYKTFATELDMQSKTQITLRTRLAAKPTRTDAIIMYSVAAVFLGGGIWAGVKSKNIKSDLQDDIDAGTPPPDEDDPRFLHGKIYAIGADTAFAVSGVTLLMAVYYTFRDKGMDSTGSTEVQTLTSELVPRRPPRRVVVEPQVSPTFAGVGMEVRW